MAITAEEIIKIIQDKELQQAFFDCFDDEDYILETVDEEGEFETLDAYLESVGLPTEFKEVDGRCDTSEFWAVIHFPVEDVYIKITGRYDFYGQCEHEYHQKVTQVFPRTIESIIYK